MRLALSLVALLAAAAPAAYAQFGAAIRTGRPMRAIGAYTLGAKVFQAQHGLRLRRTGVGDPVVRRTVSTDHVLRYGITETFEVSAVVAWRVDDLLNLGPTIDVVSPRGFTSLQLGGRFNVCVEDGPRPAISVQTRVLLPQGGDALTGFPRAHLGQTTILAVGKTLAPRVAGFANVGFTHTGRDAAARGFYALAFRVRAAENLYTFAETFGQLNSFNPDLNVGLGYLLGPDVQLDAAAGLRSLGGFEGDAPDGEEDWYLGLGVSWRVHGRGE